MAQRKTDIAMIEHLKQMVYTEQNLKAELLDALQTLVGRDESETRESGFTDDEMSWLEDARRIIAKATGGNSQSPAALPKNPLDDMDGTKTLYRVGVAVELGGFIEVRAKNKKQAEKLAFDYVEDQADLPTVFETVHRDYRVTDVLLHKPASSKAVPTKPKGVAA
jgi:hypothetical protein